MFKNVGGEDFLNIDANVETEATIQEVNGSVRTTSQPIAKRKIMRKKRESPKNSRWNAT
jgi:hypothetical protein